MTTRCPLCRVRMLVNTDCIECPECGRTEEIQTVESRLTQRTSPDKISQWAAEARAAVDKLPEPI